MNETTRQVLALLDAYKIRNGITSDSQLAAHLGITKATISYMRKGRRNAGGKVLQAIMAYCEELVAPLAAIMAKGGGAS